MAKNVVASKKMAKFSHTKLKMTKNVAPPKKRWQKKVAPPKKDGKNMSHHQKKVA